MSDQSRTKSGLAMIYKTMVHPEVDEQGLYLVDIVEYAFGNGDLSATLGEMLNLPGNYLGNAAFMFLRVARADIFHRLRLLGFEDEQLSMIIEHLESQVGLSIYLDNTD